MRAIFLLFCIIHLNFFVVLISLLSTCCFFSLQRYKDTKKYIFPQISVWKSGKHRVWKLYVLFIQLTWCCFSCLLEWRGQSMSKAFISFSMGAKQQTWGALWYWQQSGASGEIINKLGNVQFERGKSLVGSQLLWGEDACHKLSAFEFLVDSVLKLHFTYCYNYFSIAELCLC